MFRSYRYKLNNNKFSHNAISHKKLKEVLLTSSYIGEIIVKRNLEEATIASIDIARKTNSKSILLSPACASFDQYQNYEERGDHFKKLVKKYGDIKWSTLINVLELVGDPPLDEFWPMIFLK